MESNTAAVTLLLASIKGYITQINADIDSDCKKTNKAAQSRIRVNSMKLVKAAKALKAEYRKDGDK
jgi:hypothetical protein